MGLSPKQVRAIAKAPANRRAALRATYLAQRSGAGKLPTYMPFQKRTPQKKVKGKPQPKSGKLPNFLDPMCALPMPGITSEGRALAHTSLISEDFTVGSSPLAIGPDETVLVICTNTGSSGTVGTIIVCDSEGTKVSSTLLTIPTLAAPDSAGGPSASRAMKLSVSIKNCTNNLRRGGRVTYLNSSQRLPPLSTAEIGKYAGVIEGIKSSPDRRRISGEDLGRNASLLAYPCDSVNYATFRPHAGTLNDTQFLRHVVTAAPGIDPLPRSMSIIAYVFEPVSERQDYSITIRGSFYTRWPLTSVPGQTMRNMPTADAKVINHVRNHAENTANDLAHIAEGGLITSLAPRAAQLARAAGREAMTYLGVGEGAIEMAEGAVPLLAAL